jgi:DNA primase
MNNIYNIISDMDIPNGQTKRMDCPNCGGTKTFTVTNNLGSLVWNCYKASCNVRGGNRVHLTVEDIRTSMGNAQHFAEEQFELPEYVVPYLSDKAKSWLDSWDIYTNKLNFMYDVKENRVVFPVMHNNKIVDATGRALSNRLPKWKRYGKSGLPFNFGCGRVAVVVEDCVSAAVVGYGSFVGVALLGTSLQDSHKGYLAQFSTAVIALDPDALKKSFAMAKELRGHVDDVKILKLKDDLKYRNPEDMEKLNGIITN